MKKLAKLLSLLMALMLLLSSSALAELPSYLHVGQTPLVDEPVTLKVAVLCKEETTEPTNSWVYAYIEQVLGIKIDLEFFYPATRNESISLMMASGDLPDMIIGTSLTSSELSIYGEAEGMLLDLSPYITEENAPNLTKLYAENPQLRRELTTPSGAMYSLGYVALDPKGSQSMRMFYNFDWLEELNLQVPTTLDEFLDMLRAFKAKGEAEGKEVIPFGGNSARYNCTYLILNALGYNISGTWSRQKDFETTIALRNGEVVLPCYDREVFPKYLETMHTMYEEKLMEQDFYTLDKDTTKSHLVAGMYGVFPEVVALYAPLEFGAQYFGGIPLTSEYNETPFWPNYTGQTIGAFVVSAETEYPELCVAFADFVCNPEISDDFFVNVYGPSIKQTDILLDKTSGWYYDADLKDRTSQDYIDHKDEYSSYNYYRYNKIALWKPNTFGIEPIRLDDILDENGNSIKLCEYPESGDLMEVAKVRKTAGNLNDQYKLSQVLSWGKYLSQEFSPNVCYFDEETTLRVDELNTLIKEYASQEIAKFVIGTRDLSEVDKFFDELEKLGADEYVQYYADYYAATKD